MWVGFVGSLICYERFNKVIIIIIVVIIIIIIIIIITIIIIIIIIIIIVFHLLSAERIHVILRTSMIII